MSIATRNPRTIAMIIAMIESWIVTHSPCMIWGEKRYSHTTDQEIRGLEANPQMSQATTPMARAPVTQ